MLIEFRVKNFRSIKDEQTLSMVASNDDSLPENTFALTPRNPQSPKLPIHKMRFLKSAVIYGANASGKSNLLLAMHNIFYLLSHQPQLEEDRLLAIAKPFILGKSYRDAPTEITIVFTIGDEDVRHDLHLAFTPMRVIEETLIYYPKGRASMLYSRRYNPNAGKYDYDFPGGNFKGDKTGFEEKTTEKNFFLTVAATFNQPELSRISQWFKSVISLSGDMLNLRSVSLSESTRLGLIYQKFLSNHPDMAAALRKWLSCADFGIQDYEIRDDIPATFRNESIMSLLHAGDGENSYIDLKNESTGTRRWLALFYQMNQALEESGILLIDEMSSDLHPLLMECFFEIFNKASPHAQIICTTHHSSLLGAKILRRDQIWFVEKDEVGASHYYSLLDFKPHKPRKDEAFMKNYLAGSYGAIPYTLEIDQILDEKFLHTVRGEGK